MKHLCIMRMTESFRMFPSSLLRQCIIRTRDVINQMKQDGKVVDAYFMPGWHRNVMIFDCESGEELTKCTNTIPTAGLWEFEMYQLSDLDKSTEAILENMEEGDEMMPNSPIR